MIKLIIIATLTKRLDRIAPEVWCFDALKSINVSGLRLTTKHALDMRTTLDSFSPVSECALQHPYLVH